MVDYETSSFGGDGSARNDLMIVQKATIALFVDRTTQQWIARDLDGQFWSIPPVDHPWNYRQPFQPVDETQLEPVPGHYRFMLGVPNC